MFPQYKPSFGSLGNGMSPGIAPDVTCSNNSCGGLYTPINSYLRTDGDFTLSVWVQHVANANVDFTWGGYNIFDNGRFQVGAWQAMSGSNLPAYVTVYANNATASTNRLLQDTTHDVRGVDGSQWLHIVVYRSQDTLGLRVNGKAGPTLTLTNQDVGDPWANAYVGYGMYGYAWQGTMDELCLWNRVLTSDELNYLYNGGMGTKLPVP
jgi:hypothetical protein